jgi:hypothetical protein
MFCASDENISHFSLIAQLLDIFGLFFNALSIPLFNLGAVVTWGDG